MSYGVFQSAVKQKGGDLYGAAFIKVITALLCVVVGLDIAVLGIP